MLVPISGELFDSGKAQGFDKDIGDMKASSYIVSLTECQLRPAKTGDVSFK